MNTSTIRPTFIGLVFIAALALPLAGQGKSGNEIVAEMDRRLNFDECRMTIRIRDAKADGKTRQMRAKVEYSKGIGTRMEFDEPARDRGKRILMSGSSMWMSSPSVSKPVRLSGKDAFMGTSFTNDDVMNMDKSDDYDSVIASSDESGWSVVMTARSPSLPYSRIEARIGPDYLPLSMDYFARSGKKSKTVTFSDVKSFGGKPRPSVMTIVDLMKPGDSSSVIFEDIREERVERSRLSPSSLES
jgi:outer membrane lipoprotein-sorting protein